MNFLGGKAMFIAGLALGASGAGGYIYNDPFTMLKDAGYFSNINLSEPASGQSNTMQTKSGARVNTEESEADNYKTSKPHFEFYSILPELEVVVGKPKEEPTLVATASTTQKSTPEQVPPTSKPSSTSTTASVTAEGPSIASGSLMTSQNEQSSNVQKNVAPQPRLSAGEVFFLQAGSFQNAADAERRKVDLLLMGLPVDIYPVIVGGSKRYRVHVGPFSDVQEKDDARGRLRANNVEFITLRAR